jgi:hypothetical protein
MNRRGSAGLRRMPFSACSIAAALMLVDLRINQLLEVRFEAFVGAFLVGSHQTRIARHVSSKDST